MHTFMPSVLLRMRRLDALVHDAQFYPPHRQPGEAADRTRGKRWAIIGADGPRQAVFAEGGVKDSLHARGVRFRHRLAAQQIARASVAEGQRIDACPVLSPVPA